MTQQKTLAEDLELTIRKLSSKLRNSKKDIAPAHVSTLARLIDSYRGIASDQREQERKDKETNARQRLENWQRRRDKDDE